MRKYESWCDCLMRNVCGIIVIETDSPEEAKKREKIMRNCPSLIASGTTSNIIYSVYVVPKEKRWWLNYPELFPEEKSRVLIIENVTYPKESDLKLPTSKTKPCGADCNTCPFRARYNCKGCHAILHYR